MKRIVILSMLISFGTICSCQKQDSTAEQQLAQRRAELDAHEKALDERVNALDEKVSALNEKVKALAEKEKATASVQPPVSDAQSQEVIPDPAQVNVETDGRIQPPPADTGALMADPSDGDSADVEKDRIKERLAQSRLELQERQRQLSQMQKWRMSHPAASPALEATSPSPSPSPQ